MAFYSYQGINPMDMLDRTYRQFQENMSRNMQMGGAQAGWFAPRTETSAHAGGTTDVHVAEGSLKIEIGVQEFLPSDISVKTVERQIVIECKHEERTEGHGKVSRNIVRRYDIPEGVDVESIKSTLSADGLLTIYSTKHNETRERTERVVPIIPTGPRISEEASGSTSRVNSEEK